MAEATQDRIAPPDDSGRLTHNQIMLILSGLLTPQAQPLADEFVAAGMKLVHVRPSTTDPQWSTAVLAR